MNSNGCAWPDCNRVEREYSHVHLNTIIEPDPRKPIGVSLCDEHFEFLSTIEHFLLLRLAAKRHIVPLNLGRGTGSGGELSEGRRRNGY